MMLYEKFHKISKLLIALWCVETVIIVLVWLTIAITTGKIVLADQRHRSFIDVDTAPPISINDRQQNARLDILESLKKADQQKLLELEGKITARDKQIEQMAIDIQSFKNIVTTGGTLASSGIAAAAVIYGLILKARAIRNETLALNLKEHEKEKEKII